MITIVGGDRLAVWLLLAMRLTTVFARNLRLLRHGAGLTQEQVADLAGLDRNYVGKLEREENSPRSIPWRALPLRSRSTLPS